MKFIYKQSTQIRKNNIMNSKEYEVEQRRSSATKNLVLNQKHIGIIV